MNLNAAGSLAQLHQISAARRHRCLNEPQRRWFVGTLSQQPGSPTDEQLSRITGLDEKTIRRGRRELQEELATVPADRLRKEGGGQPSTEKKSLRLHLT